ncbi:MAG: hypothetical protein MUC87_19395 [Bacteroidia bacterium]|jgi:hypothetical protein|nr:hypothetical protein [Bacteroidia bacterium]
MVQVKIVQVKTILSKQDAQLVHFVHEIPDYGYGIKRFVTQSGEVAIVNFNLSGIPEVMLDIANYFDQCKSKLNIKSPASIDDAWRFFADKSASGLIWYMEYIRYTESTKEEIKELKATVLNSNIIDVDIQPITYNIWASLTKDTKERLMASFVKNPIGYSEPLTQHFSEYV